MVRPLAHLAFPHIPIRHATLLDVLLHFHTHKSCYAAGRCLALPHIRHATLLDVLLRFHTYVMLRCWTLSCTSTHTSCYTAGRCLALPRICHIMCKYLSGVTGNVLDKLGQLCVWNLKKKLFHEALRTQNYSFVVVNTRFSKWGDLSEEFKSWIYWRKINMCKLLQFRTCPPSSCDCLVSSPTRPLTGNDTM